MWKPVCITLQRFRQILKELIWNLHCTDEDQKSETIVYSYQVMEKKIIWFEKKNPSFEGLSNGHGHGDWMG